MKRRKRYDTVSALLSKGWAPVKWALSGNKSWWLSSKGLLWPKQNNLRGSGPISYCIAVPITKKCHFFKIRLFFLSGYRVRLNRNSQQKIYMVKRPLQNNTIAHQLLENLWLGLKLLISSFKKIYRIIAKLPNTSGSHTQALLTSKTSNLNFFQRELTKP